MPFSSKKFWREGYIQLIPLLLGRRFANCAGKYGSYHLQANFTLLFHLARKTYATENAYRSHVNSKKHKGIELTAHAGPPLPRPPSEEVKKSVGSTGDPVKDEIMDDIDQKIAAAGSVLSPNDCLFCPLVSISLESNLTHMSSRHSFFIPDSEYLIDITGLITYLGEKIAVGNVCIYCSDKGRDFRTLEAVRKHMIDKSHCKIAYQSEHDRLEISDFYDFSSSYPDNAEEDDWEDVGDDEPVDDVAADQEDIEDDIPSNQIAFGDSHLELVLPSGTRIGHRSMRHYYNQSPLTSRAGNQGGANSGAAIVRQLLADKNSALVPRRGGFGAFGSGTDVARARNRGEAREAGRHVREFRDQKRREDFKMRVGLIHNAQKHFR
jgi:pre-60S factor REI1